MSEISALRVDNDDLVVFDKQNKDAWVQCGNPTEIQQ